jgi:hypothetical protein
MEEGGERVQENPPGRRAGRIRNFPGYGFRILIAGGEIPIDGLSSSHQCSTKTYEPPTEVFTHDGEVLVVTRYHVGRNVYASSIDPGAEDSAFVEEEFRPFSAPNQVYPVEEQTENDELMG